jgi:ATP-dependent exoDNAse (exonuclease V) alpha subunit
MRQKDDMQFAELLNRLRENSLTDDDLVLLHTRTVTTDDSAYYANVTHLFVQNDLVNQFNQQFVSRLNTEKVVLSSIDAVQADVSADIKAKLIKSLPNNQSNTANLAMQVELAVGMKYDLTANIEVADGLTNGSSCEIKMFERRTKSPRPSIVWVKFDSKDIGKSTRKKYNHLYSKDVDRSWTPIFDIKRSFTYKYKTFKRIQFPLRTAAAKTIHKSQGDTLDQVVVSLK